MKNRNIAIIVSVLVIVLSVISVLNKDLSEINNVETLGKTLGIITLVPTILAVLLAFITKNVVISLLIGFLTGGIITTLSTQTSIIAVTTNSILNVVFDYDNLCTLSLCLLMGVLIALVKQAGGFEVISKKLEKNINTSSKANLLGLILGCLIFFDDYANALVLGPVMTRFGKKLKIAKEKIAYIVNSTSAPISGTCLLSTWAAVEMSCISNGLSTTTLVHDEFNLLSNSYGFTFYCLFTITFILIGAIIQKDFGPMYKREISSRNSNKKLIFDTDDSDDNIQLLIGLGSILILVISSMILIVISGRNNAIREMILSSDSAMTIQNIFIAIANADSVQMIIISILISISFVITTLLISKLMDGKNILKALSKGFVNMLDTILILILAWCLASIMKQIGTVYYSVDIISMNVSWKLVPVFLFICCCIISCASGSYGTMFVVMPLAIPLTQNLINIGIDIDANVYLYLIIACVISGSIFGDACSPISDCVTLTSESVDVGPTNIVSATIIYSLINVAISIISIMLIIYGYSNYFSFVIGIILQVIIYLVFGKNIQERE